MPDISGTLLAAGIVAGLVFLAARSLWRGRKSACNCGCGKCAACGGCAKERSPQESYREDPPAE